MARTRSLQYDAQRQFILETAAQAFAELGFPSASMNDIASRCGVSKGLLYHYYTSKEQMLFDVTEQYTSRLVELVREVESRVTAPKQRLPELIRVLLDEYQTSQSRHMVLLHDLRFLPAKQREQVVRNQRLVIDAFADAIRTAHDVPDDISIVKPVTMMLFGMINWTFTWLRPGKGMTYAEFADMVAEVFGAGVEVLARRRMGATKRVTTAARAPRARPRSRRSTAAPA